MAAHARCSTSSAPTAERTLKSLSNHEEIDLCIAEIALESMLLHDHHVVISEDKDNNPPRGGFCFKNLCMWHTALLVY